MAILAEIDPERAQRLRPQFPQFQAVAAPPLAAFHRVFANSRLAVASLADSSHDPFVQAVAVALRTGPPQSKERNAAIDRALLVASDQALEQYGVAASALLDLLRDARRGSDLASVLPRVLSAAVSAAAEEQQTFALLPPPAQVEALMRLGVASDPVAAAFTSAAKSDLRLAMEMAKSLPQSHLRPLVLAAVAETMSQQQPQFEK